MNRLKLLLQVDESFNKFNYSDFSNGTKDVDIYFNPKTDEFSNENKEGFQLINTLTKERFYQGSFEACIIDEIHSLQK